MTNPGPAVPTPTLRLRTCTTRAKLSVLDGPIFPFRCTLIRRHAGPCKMVPDVPRRPLDIGPLGGVLGFFKALGKLFGPKPPGGEA